jgi:hypothetical protein
LGTVGMAGAARASARADLGHARGYAQKVCVNRDFFAGERKLFHWRWIINGDFWRGRPSEMGFCPRKGLRNGNAGVCSDALYLDL